MNEAKLREYLPAYLKRALKRRYEGKFLSRYKTRWRYNYRIKTCVNVALQQLGGRAGSWSEWNKWFFENYGHEELPAGQFYYCNTESSFNSETKLFTIKFFIFWPPFDKPEDGYEVSFLWDSTEKLDKKGSQLSLFE